MKSIKLNAIVGLLVCAAATTTLVGAENFGGTLLTAAAPADAQVVKDLFATDVSDMSDLRKDRTIKELRDLASVLASQPSASAQLASNGSGSRTYTPEQWAPLMPVAMAATKDNEETKKRFADLPNWQKGLATKCKAQGIIDHTKKIAGKQDDAGIVWTYCDKDIYGPWDRGLGEFYAWGANWVPSVAGSVDWTAEPKEYGKK